MKSVKEIAYTRCASSAQIIDIPIFNSQEKIINNYGKNNDIKLLKVFYDIGTGLDFEREGWSKLMKFLNDRQNEMDFLIVSSLDRISRNELNVRDMLDFLESEYKVIVVYPKELSLLDNLLTGKNIRIE